MASDRRLFAIVVWAGVIANWAFGLWVVLFDPQTLLEALRLGAVESTVWIYNYAVLLMILSLFYIPAAHDPFRYRANAWLLIVGRLVPATTFFVGVALGFMPPAFVGLGLADGTIGMIELVLLVRIIRGARRAHSPVAA